MGATSQVATYSGKAVHDRRQTHFTPSNADRVLSELIGVVERQSVFMELHGDELRMAASSGLGCSCPLTRCRVAVAAPAQYLFFEHARAPGALERTALGGGVLAASDFRTRA